MHARPAHRLAHALTIAACLLAPAVWAHEPPPVAELETQLAQLKQQLANPELAPAARFELLTRCDEVERRLIAAAPADDRVPTWLADRAAAALDLAAKDGADVSVLFGVPTAAELRQVRSRAKEGLDLTRRAEEAVAQAVARLEAELVDRRNPEQAKARAPMVEASLQNLIDVEQAQRLPYLKALARLLVSACAIDEPTRESAQAAVKELSVLAPAPGPLADARRLALGAALIQTAIGLPDRCDEALKAAANQLEPLASQYKPGAPTVQNALALKARLGLIRAGIDVPPRPHDGDRATERSLDALEAEARAASLLDRAAREPAGRTLLISSAIRTLLAATDGADASSEALRARAYDKIAASIPADLPIDRLPPEAALARAISRVRETGTGDPAARQEAAALLARLADRADSPAALRAQARWERAVIIAAGAEPLAELDAVTLVFHADPECDKAMPAAQRVVELFARQQGGAPDGLASLPDAWRARLPALRDALDLLARRDAAQADRWRLERARLCVFDLSGPEPLQALDRALAITDPLDEPGGARTPQALADAIFRTLDARRAAAAAWSDRASTANAKREWDALVPLASRTLAWARKHDPDREPGYALLLGESLTGAGDPQGATVLAALIGGPLDRPESASWSRLRLALGRAQHLAGQDAKAIVTLRELADRLEPPPGSTTRDPVYWAAWSEMLDIWQAQNIDKQDIRVQIKRLELLDPKLGGPPHADRIRKVLAAVGE